MTKKFDALLRVFFKDNVNEPTRAEIQRKISRAGFENVKVTRTGKCLDLRLRATVRLTARLSIKRMCKKLLVHPLLEDYSIESIDPVEELFS